MISITEGIKSDIAYLENDKTRALDQRVIQFIIDAQRDFAHTRGLHVMRIDGLHRNLIIGRMSYYLDHADALPALRQRIFDFYGEGKWVIAAANYYFPTETVTALVPPFRHHDVNEKMAAEIRPLPTDNDIDQGFMVFDRGLVSYHGREEAMLIAVENGQIRRRAGSQYYQGNELYSEDLW